MSNNSTVDVQDTLQKKKARGKKTEQELVDILQGLGFNARRNAASGVGGFVTDVEACSATTYLAIEVKSSRRRYAAIPHHQLEKIRQDLWFIQPINLEKFGVIAAKFPGTKPPWVIHRLGEEEFQKESVVIHRGEASNWLPTGVETKYFSLKPSPDYFQTHLGRPKRPDVPKVQCPVCKEASFPPRVYKKEGKDYFRYYHGKVNGKRLEHLSKIIVPPLFAPI